MAVWPLSLTGVALGAGWSVTMTRVGVGWGRVVGAADVGVAGAGFVVGRSGASTGWVVAVDVARGVAVMVRGGSVAVAVSVRVGRGVDGSADV